MAFFRNIFLKFLVSLLGFGLAGTALAAHEGGAGNVSHSPDITFTLETAIADGKLVFKGASGNIMGEINPTLEIPEGAVVQINLVNTDGAVHDIAIPEFNSQSEHISSKGAATAIVFKANKEGNFEYFCTLPGHKAAGMVGEIVVGEPASDTKPKAPGISYDPTQVGEPVGKRAPQDVTIDLLTTEVEARLGDKSTYKFWTFNNKVPGPFIRVREGDRVTINVTNPKDSTHIHSIDLHAVTGPGGGADVTQVPPGQTKSFTFTAKHPGLFVYHCATPMVAQHITNGMYGMILVEPDGGLPEVDKEFYIMQGELYTAKPHGASGLQEFSLENLLAENPQHMMFNGAMDALTKIHKMETNVGDTVRIFFGVGGPNLISSFHVIGEVFDRVYDQASLTSKPLTDVQTTLVPPGGATMVEFTTDYPGRYVLVDHALSRVEKGLAGFLDVHGEADKNIFHSDHEEH